MAAGKKLKSYTEKEKQTLCGLVKYPDLNDRELAEKLKIKHSTITAIRRRMRSSNDLISIKIPMLQYFGFEILTISYGKLNHNIAIENKNMIMDKCSKLHNNSFIFCSSDDMAFMISLYRNYTEVKKDIAELQRFLSMHDLLTEESWNHALFPFEVSKILNYFDYSPVLCRYFDMKRESEKTPSLDYETMRSVELSAKERAVLHGLVNDPELPNNALAKKIKVSRQAISNIKQRLTDDGVIKSLNIPNINEIGLEILVLSHVFFNPKCMMKDRRKGINYLLQETPQLFTITGSFESVMLHSVANYEEYNFYKNKLLSIYSTHSFIRGEPKIMLFPISDLIFHKYYDFSSIMSLIKD
ncbi:MAG: Lrp/AsnC family transcriptional regulator [Thermoplasmata archaeon]|nr:Lrp/AsnC family transcriptional regulator [Thermoplasmata archaeon]